MAISVLIASDYNELRRRLGAIIAMTPDSIPDAELQSFVDGKREDVPATFAETRLVGRPQEVVKQVQAYVDAGIDHFMLWFMDSPSSDGLDLFAEQVMPAFATEGDT